MKSPAYLVVAMGLSVLAGCAQPIQNVAVPPPSLQTAYQPQPYEKPMPPQQGYAQPSYAAPSGAAGPTGYAAPPQPNPYGSYQALPDQAAYVKAYQTQREPRVMVIVLAPKHAKTYASIHATPEDFDAIGLSMINLLGANGQVDIQNASMAKQVLNREKFLRLQNGDPAVVPLLKQQLNTDVLVEIRAAPTAQANAGPAVRLLAQTVSTTDARILATHYIDLPLPMSKPMIDQCTSYLADKTMQSLATIWSGAPGVLNPITVRIYHAATVDDVLQIKRFIQKVPGVSLVINRGMTGGSTTAYGQLDVQYGGGPGDFYSALKQELGVSTGLKATDLQNNTVDLEITGPMVLKTTTIKTITRVRTETHTTVKTVNENPIMPAH